jgi:four helix bundle protein
MTLKIYPIVLDLVRRLSPYLPALRARSATPGDQLERALISIRLKLAEGAYSRGKNRHARYQAAAASAREALACLETAGGAGLDRLTRAGARQNGQARDRHSRSIGRSSTLNWPGSAGSRCRAPAKPAPKPFTALVRARGAAG